jgi:probable HAF family extracellular repeat protein
VINAGGGLFTDAFLRNGGRLTNLGDLGNGSQGNGINDRGQVAGWSFNTTPDPADPGIPEQRAVLWDKGAMLDIGTLGGPHAQATAIDDRGQITGSAMADLAGGGAFLWSRGSMTALATLGVPCATGSAIDDRGRIVGDVCTAIPDPSLAGATEDHPALWDRGTVRDLGLFPGDPDAQALAINNRGQIVGQSGDQSGPFRAVLWQDGGLIDLNTLIRTGSGWQLLSADGINDRGQIVGYGISPNGSVHGFLLTPAYGRGHGATAMSTPLLEARARAAMAQLPANVRAFLGQHRLGKAGIGYRP